MKLSTKEILLLAAEAAVDPRTIKNIYRGGESKASVVERVCEAAVRINVAVPPKSKTRSRGRRPAGGVA